MSAQLPSIVIVGRPNVGKSTLFNRLTGTRRSIVTNEPGITRDRIYGTAEWRGHRFEVVDTGGIIPDEQAGIPGEILRQARVAIESAAQLVLVVDARAGITPLDAELARLLRQTGKPLAIAANKVDTAQQESLSAEFHKLSKHVFGISSEHGLGVDDLLDHIADSVGAGLAPPSSETSSVGADETTPPDEIRVAIIGRPNVGKSTLLNRLVGAERAIVSPIPGTTRDAVDIMIEREDRRYRLVDTAGIRRKGKTKLVAEKLSVVMARRHLEQCDVALCVVDASQGVTSNDATIASYAQQSGRACIIVMNKFDLAVQLAAEKSANEAQRHREQQKDKRAAGSQKAVRNVRTERARLAVSKGRAAHVGPHAPLLHDYEKIVRAKLKFLDYAPVAFLSAMTGERTENLFEMIAKVAAAHRRRVTTGELNRWLETVDLERGTSPAGRKVKIYYVTQASTAPPTFVLFTNQSRPLHFSYERFLDNQLRAHFDFTGTPIRFNQRLKKR